MILELLRELESVLSLTGPTRGFDAREDSRAPDWRKQEGLAPGKMPGSRFGDPELGPQIRNNCYLLFIYTSSEVSHVFLVALIIDVDSELKFFLLLLLILYFRG